MPDEMLFDPNTGQPAGNPLDMVKEYGYCPFGSSMQIVQAVAGSALDPRAQRTAQPLMMPMHLPCVGPRCQLWITVGQGMCSFRRIALDAKAIGDEADRRRAV